MEVRFNSTLRGKCGLRAIQLKLPEGATVRDALVETVARLPVLDGEILEGDVLQPSVVVFLNGRGIRFFDGLDTVLRHGQVLDVFPRTGAQKVFVKE